MWSHLVRLLCLLAVLFSSCIVRPAAVVVTRRPGPPRPAHVVGAPCFGGVYVRGYYDHWGRWHYPQWRCPGGTVIRER